MMIKGGLSTSAPGYGGLHLCALLHHGHRPLRLLRLAPVSCSFRWDPVRNQRLDVTDAEEGARLASEDDSRANHWWIEMIWRLQESQHWNNWDTKEAAAFQLQSIFSCFRASWHSTKHKRTDGRQTISHRWCPHTCVQNYMYIHIDCIMYWVLYMI